MNIFFSPALLLVIFLSSGMAWAQGGYIDRKGQEMQPSQTASADREGQSLDTSKRPGSYKAKKTNSKTPRVTHIKKSLVTNPKTASQGSSLGQYGASEAQSYGSQVNAGGSGLSIIGPNPSAGPGSTSFLDGYLLKSLKEDGTARKKVSTGKVSTEKQPKENLQKSIKDLLY
jgi:hypothetical protein